MSSHKEDEDQITSDSMDGLIRWALHDSVANAEPAPDVWERIQRQVLIESEPETARAPIRYKPPTRRPWLGWLVGAGASFPVPGDPRAGWQRRLYPFDMRASLSVVRIIEGTMPVLRLVA